MSRYLDICRCVVDRESIVNIASALEMAASSAGPGSDSLRSFSFLRRSRCCSALFAGSLDGIAEMTKPEGLRAVVKFAESEKPEGGSELF